MTWRYYTKTLFRNTLGNIPENTFVCPYNVTAEACTKEIKPFCSGVIQKGNSCYIIYSSEINAKDNIKKLDIDFDYLVTDCASCESTLLDYHKYIECTPIPERKSINFGDLIALKGIKFKFKKPVKITFHKPCHLKNDTFLQRILTNCENVEYIEMKNYDNCCGFAGSFGIKNRKYSIELSKQKAQNIIETGADYVITTCPSCVLGLNQGLLLKGSKTKVISLLEFLSKADIIE